MAFMGHFIRGRERERERGGREKERESLLPY